VTSTARTTPIGAIVAGGLILSLGLGIRHGFGLFLPPMTAAHGWGRETFSLALAVQNLTWGLVQPFFGMVADRFGAGRAVAAGVAFYVAGLAVMPFAETGLTLVLSAGLLIGTGLGGTGFGVVYGAISRRVPTAQQSSALGGAGALGSLGQFLMMPVTHHLIGHLGWPATLTVLAGTSGLMAPLAFLLVKQRRAADRSPASAAPMPLGVVLREAMRHRGFWLLNLGFVVCGFQLVFITNHLPAFLADHGLPSATAMTALAVIGAANILGTWLCGVLGGRLRGKHVLAAVYLLRTVATVAYVSVPVTAVSTIGYAAAMGLTWLGTVPLTTGVVARIFGVQYLATLFGFVFLGHQIGGFFGVWLAGAVFDATHSYQAIWMISIGLGLMSSIVHIPIDDRTLALPRAAPLPARP
jgi:MFS family permease